MAKAKVTKNDITTHSQNGAIQVVGFGKRTPGPSAVKEAAEMQALGLNWYREGIKNDTRKCPHCHQPLRGINIDCKGDYVACTSCNTGFVTYARLN